MTRCINKHFTRNMTTVMTAVFIAVLVITVPVQAQNGNGQGQGGPPPVTINNTTANPVPVNGLVGAVLLLPQNAFSLVPTQPVTSFSGTDVEPDPVGTRYAISSITVTNPTAGDGTMSILAQAASITVTTCRFSSFGAAGAGSGPQIYVPAKTTIQITFPQPYVTAPVTATGNQICLVAGGFGFVGATWSAVGYKLLP